MIKCELCKNLFGLDKVRQKSENRYWCIDCDINDQIEKEDLEFSDSAYGMLREADRLKG